MPETIPKLSDRGQGRAVLLLHGGGGPFTLFGLSKNLAAKARVLLPTHPGFDGTPRPDHLDSAAALARFYLAMIEHLGLDEVVLIGSSIGGWVAAEMAVGGGSRIAGLILLNPVGIKVPGESVVDTSGMTRPELVKLASHNPQAILANMPPPTPELVAMQAGNAASLAAYDHGESMMAEGLREKLAAVTAPALVLWGESDGLATPAYGKAYSAAFANGSFELVAEAGHLPQIEQPDRVLARIGEFILTLDEAQNPS